MQGERRLSGVGETRRIWLEWNGPAIPAAAAWLMRNAADKTDGVCDLSSVFCVVPGQRAGRSLIAELLTRCRADNVHLLPPNVSTPGAMVDVLSDTASDPLASATERLLAWMSVLRDAPDNLIERLVPHPPDATALSEWRRLALTLSRLQEELAAAELTFAMVPDQAATLQLFSEHDRWRALAGIEDAYHRVLADHGLIDPQVARWRAVKQDASGSGRSLVLVGVVELNQLQRHAFGRFDGDITALIHAPETLNERFDDLGCVRTDAWREATIDIDESTIVSVDQRHDQAQAVVQSIGAYNGRFGANEITIGLADSSLEASVERCAAWADLTVRPATGRPLARSAPLRFLSEAAAWIDQQRFAHLASLVRHPDVERWLRAGRRNKDDDDNDAGDAIESVQTLLDRYFTECLHERYTGSWLAESKYVGRMRRLTDAIATLLAPLAEPGSRPIGAWCDRALEVLRELYAGRRFGAGLDLNQPTTAALEELRDVCAELAAAPRGLQPVLTGPAAIDLMLAQASALQVVTEPRRDQIDLLGWLELHLDPAPALVIAGFNDGFAPEASTADAFLPDALRRMLGLTSNDDRYARDAYLLEAIRHSRESITIISGRFDGVGDPLMPSRLLLAVERKAIAARVVQLCAASDGQVWKPPIGLATPAEVSAFAIPPLPEDIPVPKRMSVTWFRDYLQCPYRFALRRLLRISEKTDAAAELDPLRFGSLTHDVLHAFSEEHDLRDCTDERRINDALQETMRELAKSQFGSHPLPAVQIQLAWLSQRLEHFAAFQAEHQSRGWRTVHCEYPLADDAVLEVPGEDPMPIAGRIDRIDRHEKTGEWLIIDYKTGEKGQKPESTHRSFKPNANTYDTDWVDVQLPLYQHLGKQSGITGETRLAYITLPKDPAAAGLHCADWNEDDIASALQTARLVVRDVRLGRFDRIALSPSKFDDFARICQTTVFGVAMDPDEDVSNGD